VITLVSLFFVTGNEELLGGIACIALACWDRCHT